NYTEYGEYYPITVSAKGKIHARTKGRYFSPALFSHYANYVLELYKTVTADIYSGANKVNPMATEDELLCQLCDLSSARRVHSLLNARDSRENKMDETEIEKFESEVTGDGDMDG